MINRQFFEEMNEPFVKKGNMEINREMFEAWLFSQPLERKFDFHNIYECALCCFLREVCGSIDPIVGNISVLPKGLGGESIAMPKWLDSNDHAKAVLRANPLTVANMQSRYISLFGDPRETEPTETPTPLEKR